MSSLKTANSLGSGLCSGKCEPGWFKNREGWRQGASLESSSVTYFGCYLQLAHMFTPALLPRLLSWDHTSSAVEDKTLYYSNLRYK